MTVTKCICSIKEKYYGTAPTDAVGEKRPVARFLNNRSLIKIFYLDGLIIVY